MQTTAEQGEGGTAMFEQEIEMEKRSSSVLPLLLLVALIVGFVGVAGYYVVEMRKVLPLEEATKIVAKVLQDQAPATLSFYTGDVNGSIEDNAKDPKYRLLEKAGLVTLGKPKGTYSEIIPVELTPKGEDMFKQIAGVTQKKTEFGTVKYVVPVATRKLLSVSDVKMVNSSRATVNLTWTWVTNPMGELLEASGPLVQSFSTWERATLIEKDGAAFYHGPPTKVVVALSKVDNVWQIATD